jgi:hypothetical protein
MATVKKIIFKFPKSMGACADKLHELKTKRLAGQKLVDEVEAEEKALKQYIIDNLPKTDSGASGMYYRVAVVSKQIPQLDGEHEEDFYKYVSKTKRWDLLQKRLSTTAIQEMLDAGKVVPGIKMFQTTTVSLNKI